MRLSRKLELENLTRTDDGAGGFSHAWARLGTVWGAVEPRTAGVVVGQETTVSTARYRVTVRAVPFESSARPKPGQRFRDGARVFMIRSVQDAKDARFLLCLVEEEAGT